MSYWLHRISHEWEISYPLLDMGFLSIGWNCYSNSNILELIINEGLAGFNHFMSGENEGSRSRWGLWYFSQFCVGDIVIVPLYNGELAICKIVGQPFSASNKHGISLKNKDGDNVLVDENGFYCLKP